MLIIMQTVPSIRIPVLSNQDFSSPSNTCSQCLLSFSSKQDLDFHKDFLEPLHSINELSAENNFECTKCQKIFKSNQGLRQHEGKVHFSSKKAKCKYCNKRFKNTYAVKYHRIQVHEKRNRVECYLCGKVLYNRFNFKNHLKKCQQKFFGDKALMTVGEE